MYQKARKVKVVLFIIFLLGILLCGLTLSIAFFPPVLTVQSDPPGADIYVNCVKRKIETPGHMRLLSIFGNSKVVVSKNGYLPVSQDANFSIFRRNVTIDAKLEQETFSSGHSNIEVGWVDGSRYPEVKVMVKVKDHNNNLVSDLKKEHITLTETREEQCLITQPQFDLREVNKLDIVFFIDVTSSMSGTLAIVKRNIEAFCDLLLARNINFRLAGYSFDDMVPYNDRFDFTPEFTGEGDARKMVRRFKKWLSSLKAKGGGDGNENCLDSIINACDHSLDYREDATKVGVLITDTSAHVAGDGGNSLTTATFQTTREKMQTMGLKLYYASPRDEYETQLNAQNLGWPFNATVLTKKFSDELIGWYVVTFKDDIGLEKNKARRCRIGVKLTPGETGQSKEYSRSFVFYPLIQ
jgi:Integrin beta chain VWA domain/PEGA domain